MGPKASNAAGPPPPDPIRIPKAEDPDVMEAMRRKFRSQSEARQGRESTRLAPATGGASYTRTTLG